jgi:predicted acetyltransferase
VANVQVVEAGPEEQERLGALFELYVYDFSEQLGLDVQEDGRFLVPPLATYWSDPLRHPFLIMVGDKIAGFALVQERSHLTGNEGVRDMAEFFVLRKYRRLGVGERAATWLFIQFRGAWEVRERLENPGATAFWRRVIGRYTSGRYEDVVWDNVTWRGPVQSFNHESMAPGPRA